MMEMQTDQKAVTLRFLYAYGIYFSKYKHVRSVSGFQTPNEWTVVCLCSEFIRMHCLYKEVSISVSVFSLRS
jgi:hypothetical protein